MSSGQWALFIGVYLGTYALTIGLFYRLILGPMYKRQAEARERRAQAAHEQALRIIRGETTTDPHGLFGIGLDDEFPQALFDHLTNAHSELPVGEFPAKCDECKRLANADKLRTTGGAR